MRLFIFFKIKHLEVTRSKASRATQEYLKGTMFLSFSSALNIYLFFPDLKKGAELLINIFKF